jgi:hypothetical protein
VTGPPPGTASLLLRVRSASFDHPPQVSLMSLPSPTPPSRLGTYAREVLELLAGHKAAAEIVIGGGIALAHYVDYRDRYEAKNPGLSAGAATAKVLHALERLEIQRPLASIQDVGQRHEAAAVRNWYRDVFCRQPT